MTASRNVDVHFVSVPSVRVQLRVHIEIMLSIIGSHSPVTFRNTDIVYGVNR